MEFVKFKCKKHNNENKFYYHTDIIINDDKYLLITINDTNIILFRIIINNEISFINGNMSNKYIEIKPNEKYYYEIFDEDTANINKNKSYIDEIDFLQSYLIVSHYKSILPFCIKLNMKILFFNIDEIDCHILNYGELNNYITFNISTDEFIINNKSNICIQNFNLGTIDFEKSIKLHNHSIDLYNNVLRQGIKFQSNKYKFNLLSLYEKSNMLLTYKSDDIHNFNYCNNNITNVFKFCLTQDNNVLIKIPFEIINSYKKLLEHSIIDKEKFEQCIKCIITNGYKNKNSNYIVFNVIENQVLDYDDKINEVSYNELIIKYNELYKSNEILKKRYSKLK